jgi:hypothetical protein
MPKRHQRIHTRLTEIGAYAYTGYIAGAAERICRREAQKAGVEHPTLRCADCPLRERCPLQERD